MREVYFEGMLLQAGLIFALGPQNLFILESGLKKHYHVTVSFVCFFCDLALIMLGVAGAATFFTQFPEIKIAVGLMGVGFLIFYGVGKLLHSDKDHIQIEAHGKRSCFRAAIFSAVLFSVVNPHAYLDGIVLIGGYSSKYSDLWTRVALGLGAASFSLLWFLILSVGASFMVPFFQGPRKMKLIMSTAGVILIVMSAKLGVDVFSWIEELYPESLASFGAGEN